jgi:hypothetical protein
MQKKGDPRNEGTTQDVHENKRPKKSKSKYPVMFMKINELLCLSQDF